MIFFKKKFFLLLLFSLCTLTVLAHPHVPDVTFTLTSLQTCLYLGVLPLAGAGWWCSFRLRALVWLGNKLLEVVASVSSPAERGTSFWGEAADTQRGGECGGGTRMNRIALIRSSPLRSRDGGHGADSADSEAKHHRSPPLAMMTPSLCARAAPMQWSWRDLYCFVSGHIQVGAW